MTYSVPQHRKLRTALPVPRSIALQKRRTESVSAGTVTTTPNPAAPRAIIAHATHELIVLDCAGSWDSVLRLLPSVVISEELIDDAASVIEETLAALSTAVHR